MKNKAKRTMYLLIIAIALLLAATLVPALQQSTFKEWLIGAGFGLMIAAIISIITLVIGYAKATKTSS